MAQESGVFTNIDAFVKYLGEHGETESTIIATDLGASEKNIEEWAKVLENSNMAKIVYKMGKMFVGPASTQQTGKIEEKQLADVKKTVLDSEISAQQTGADRIKQRLAELDSAVSKAELSLKNNSGNIRASIDKIEALKNQAYAPFSQLKSEKDELDKFSKEIQDIVNTLSGSENLAKVVLQNRNNSNAALEDLKSKIHAFEKGTSEIISSYDKAVREERAKLAEFDKNMKVEIKALRELTGEDEKDMKKYDKAFADYKAESVKVRKSLDKNKANLLDKIAKSKSEIDTSYASAEEEMKKLDAAFSEAKGELVQYDEMSKKLSQIRKEIDAVEAQLNGLNEKIGELEESSRSIASSKGSTEEKNARIKELEDKKEGTSSELDKASARLDEIQKGVDNV